MKRDGRIERVTCFQDLLAREEATVLSSESSIERITILQSAIEDEERIILNRENNFFVSLITLKPTVRSRLMKNMTILVPDLLNKKVLVPAIQNMIGTTGDYSFELKNASITEMPDDVDFAILPFRHPSEHYIGKILFETELNLYAAPKYLEQHGEPNHLEDLSKHTTIITTKGDILRYFANMVYAPIFFNDNPIKTDLLTSAMDLGEQGVGLVCAADSIVEINKYKLHKIKKLENTYAFPFVFNVHKKNKDLSIAERLLTEVRRAIEVA